MGIEVKELQKSNNRLEEKINADNQRIFTDMICYIRGGDLTAYDQELVRRDLSEMILAAQERGEDIHSVIGGDFKEFCDEVIESLSPKTTKEKIVEGLDIFCSCTAILGAITILFSADLRRIVEELLSKQPADYSVGISLGMIISAVIIMAASIFIVNTISKNAFKKFSGSHRINRVLIGGATGAGVLALFMIVAKLNDHVVFSVPIFLVLVLLVLFYIAHKLLSRI